MFVLKLPAFENMRREATVLSKIYRYCQILCNEYALVEIQNKKIIYCLTYDIQKKALTRDVT